MPLSLTLPNFLLFQLGWFACVLGGAGQWHIAGSLAALMVVGWHLARAGNRLDELKLLLIAMLVGLVWDSLLVSLGVLQYEHGVLGAWLAPHWIVVMWALFATTLNLSLRWLRGRYWLAALFGAVGGPLAFVAGQKLGAVTMPRPELAIAALAVGWGVMMPLLMWLSQRFDGFRRQAQAGVA